MLTTKQRKPQRPVPLPCDKLAALPTPRLPAYEKALYRVIPNDEEDWIWGCGCSFWTSEVKAILDTREHVNRDTRHRHVNH
jgi:hypothetical protein